MNDDALIRLQQRIAKLESAHRTWRRFAACSAISLACLGLMAAQKANNIKADQIEAQRIVIRDASGKEMIILGMIDNKYPGMRLHAPGGQSGASFFTSADHATIALMDNNGASSITLNSGGASTAPDISMVRVGPGRKVQRLFRAP
jgi:hypothetical protein